MIMQCLFGIIYLEYVSKADNSDLESMFCTITQTSVLFPSPSCVGEAYAECGYQQRLQTASVDVPTQVPIVGFGAHEAAVQEVEHGGAHSGQGTRDSDEVGPRKQVGCAVHGCVPLTVRLDAKHDDGRAEQADCGNRAAHNSLFVCNILVG